MDPLRPVACMLALTVLSPRPGHGPTLGGALLEVHCPALGDEEGVELRAVMRREPGVHTWPRSLAVFVEGAQVARIDPPREGSRRGDAPLEISEHLHRTGGAFVLRIEADGGAHRVADFAIAAVRTAPRRSTSELLAECLARPPAPFREAAELWSYLRCAEEGCTEPEVECATPWLQPLSCPLTRERLRVPSRGSACRHLRCFELEAYLVTSVAMAFHRRWRCPVCDLRLPPSDLVVCALTARLLQSAGAEATSVPLEARSFEEEASAARRRRSGKRRWRHSALRPPGAETVAAAKPQPPAAWGHRLRAGWGMAPGVILALE